MQKKKRKKQSDKYVEQEAKEKAEIHFTPKQLNSMAVEYFKKQKMAPALKSLEQALQLTPKNVKVALSLLKVLLAIHRSDGLDADQKELAATTMDAVGKAQLQEVQAMHYKEIYSELMPVVKRHFDQKVSANDDDEAPEIEVEVS